VARTENRSPPSARRGVAFAEALAVWVRVAALSFGGPAGQIAVMHRILVEEKRWVSESRFLHALNYCMLLPGPEAQQLATYIGWLLHRTPGGLAAGALFVLPGFVAILGLSVLYAVFQRTTVVSAVFFGLKAAVLAVVLEAVVRIGRRALRNRLMIGIAALAFVALFFLRVPFPAVVLTAGAIGLLAARRWPEAVPAVATHGSGGHDGEDDLADGDARRAGGVTAGRTARVLAVWLGLWAAPFVVLVPWLGSSHVLVTEGLFFSKAAMVTFGGAYSVLAYIGQQAVDVYRWLAPGEMLDGLGMAETTPGPLIQVVQFVGFMGAYRNPAPFTPLVAGLLGSVVTTWVTYTPCFLWIFLGAPHVERLRGNRAVTAALATITAAVVGVILNLALWFAVHVAFARVDEVRWYGVRLLVPDPSTASWASILVAAAAFFAIFRLRWGMGRTLAASALGGSLVYLASAS
jgi:chromate transporter